MGFVGRGLPSRPTTPCASFRDQYSDRHAEREKLFSDFFCPQNYLLMIKTTLESRFILCLAVLVVCVDSTAAVAMELCGSGPRVSCVVDGDTFWFGGEKFRLAGIDAPEVTEPCIEARILAARSAERLRALLSTGEPSIARAGADRYGRTLAAFSVGGRDLGDQLVAEGLARPWPGRKVEWCRQ